MTIKEIAAKAGVSIATVSHVINHTRYVSPELVDKIEAIIEESGYSEKIKKKVRKIRSGRSSQIVAVFPNIKSALYCDLCNQLQYYATSQGYQFYTAVTNDNLEEEKSILQNLIVPRPSASFSPRQAAIRLPIHFSMNPVSRLYVSNDSSMTMSLRGSFLITPKHFTPLLPIFLRADTKMCCFW